VLLRPPILIDRFRIPVIRRTDAETGERSSGSSIFDHSLGLDDPPNVLAPLPSLTALAAERIASSSSQANRRLMVLLDDSPPLLFS
jgi:hypothetical protein